MTVNMDPRQVSALAVVLHCVPGAFIGDCAIPRLAYAVVETVAEVFTIPAVVVGLMYCPTVPADAFTYTGPLVTTMALMAVVCVVPLQAPMTPNIGSVVALVGVP